MHSSHVSAIDTSLIITGAKVDLNQGIIEHTRYFGHRLTWVEVGFQLQASAVSAEQLTNAGLYIGWLERLLIVTADGAALLQCP